MIVADLGDGTVATWFFDDEQSMDGAVAELERLFGPPGSLQC